MEGKINMKALNEEIKRNSNKKKFMTRNSNIKILLNKLIPFKNHPFPLYEGQRLEDMVKSVSEFGIITPIIVRPVAETDKYEILSGHNRVEAAKIAGLKSAPAIIRKNLTDEEAMLFVTESNFHQRSFTDLKPSEKASTVSFHYEAMKKKSGYRSDLLEEIEELSCAPVGPRMKTREKVGKQYGLGKTTIARYLHINNLIPELKKRFDQDEICMRAAESLSFLKCEEQKIIEELLADGRKINMNQAEMIKTQATETELTKASIDEILKSKNRKTQVKSVNLKSQSILKYFKPEQNTEEIEKTVLAALEMYFSTVKDN